MPTKVNSTPKRQSTISTLITTTSYLVLAVGFVWYASTYDWPHAIATIAVALTVWLAAWTIRRYGLRTPMWFLPAFQLFLIVSLFFGSTLGLYQQYWWYDDVLHLSWGAGSVVLAFVLFDHLHDGLHTLATAHPFFLALFAFSFAVMTSTLWEIVEFVADSTFGFNTQQGGWPDTMIDLVLDTLGATLVSAWSYRWLRIRRVLPFVASTATNR